MTVKTNRVKHSALFAVLAAAGALPSLAHAQLITDDRGFRVEKVSFADLDPTRPAGMKILVRRIRNAAENVCGPMPEPMQDPAETKVVSACMNTAEHNAIAFVQRTAIAAKTTPTRAEEKFAEVKPAP